MPRTRAATTGAEVRGIEVVHRATECAERIVVWNAAPVRSASGRVVGAVAVGRDVTERRAAEREQEEFVHIISHDLRAPLTIILGQAQMVKRAIDKPNVVQDSAEAIVTSARRMDRMVQDLVDSARLGSGQLSLGVRPVDLRQFVLDLRERWAAARVWPVERVEVEAPPDLPPVLADPDRLERVLTNLLTNALKYSRAETPVRVSLTQYSRKVVTSVTDEGPGIPPDELPHLFERYFRSSKAREHREGLGLGLYITKGLVEAQGGHVWAESTVGKGSTFSFTLPLAS
jgi:signal transduction histidine kinase